MFSITWSILNLPFKESSQDLFSSHKGILPRHPFERKEKSQHTTKLKDLANINPTRTETEITASV